MAAEMPEIVVAHVETPTQYAEGGFKGRARPQWSINLLPLFLWHQW